MNLQIDFYFVFICVPIHTHTHVHDYHRGMYYRSTILFIYIVFFFFLVTYFVLREFSCSLRPSPWSCTEQRTFQEVCDYAFVSFCTAFVRYVIEMLYQSLVFRWIFWRWEILRTEPMSNGVCNLLTVDSAFMQGVKKVFGIGEEQKELVDPYFVFNFAGKEVRTVYSDKNIEVRAWTWGTMLGPLHYERFRI